VARTIQQASLPKEVPELQGWQVTPYYRPAREVGGDFYDFHLLSEGRLGLAVGDATGKGVPAALVMASDSWDPSRKHFLRFLRFLRNLSLGIVRYRWVAGAGQGQSPAKQE
jgi:hypothetical protein